MRASVIVLVVGVLLTSSLALAVPSKLAQQGRLLDGDEVPLSGSHQLDYALFDAATGGTELWSESQQVSFDDGYYSVELGAIEPLDDLVVSPLDIWLELAVDGVPLEPRMQLVSVPFSLRAESTQHVDGGIVDASEVSVGGQVVISPHGEWVGPAIPLAWGTLTDVPAELLDGDADSLAALACSTGQVPAYDQASDLWLCSAPSGQDTLSLLTCTDGQLVNWNAQVAQWQCDDQFHLSEAAIEELVTNGVIDLAGGSTLAGAPLATLSDLTSSLPWSAITGIPSELQDGDADTLLGLPCADGYVAKFSALLGAWDCALDLDTQLSEAEVDAMVSDNGYSSGSHTVDTNTQLSEAEVDAMVSDNGYSTGSHTVDTNTQLSEAEVDAMVSDNGYSSGSHTVDTNTQLTETQVENYVTNGPLALGSGTTIAGVPITTGAHTLDTNTQLSEGQVEAFITDAAIGLASGSTVGGIPITTGAHTTQLSWNSISGIPGDLSDGDSDLLSGLTCQSNEVPKWSGASASWECAVDVNYVDTDTNTQLTESQVENYVANGPIGLATGSTVGGQVLAGGPHTTSIAWSSISSMPSEFSDGDSDILGGLSCAGGQVAQYDSSVSQWVCAAYQALTESQVEGFISNGPISLNAATTVAGQSILSVGNNGEVTPSVNLNFASSTLSVDANSNRVGIGSANPLRSLEVNTGDGLRINNSNTGDGGYLELTNSGDNTHSWTMERDSNGSFKVGHHTGFGRGVGTTTTPLLIDQSDRLGLGTSTPQATLHVAGGSNSRVRVEGSFSGLDFYDGPNHKGYVGQSSTDTAEMTTVAATDNSGLITFETIEGGAPYERVRITNAGNVGIGTPSPSERLSVAGTIESTSGGVKFPDGTTQTSAAPGGAAGGVMYIRFNQSCPSGWNQYDSDQAMMGAYASDICYRSDTSCLVMYIPGDQYCPTGWNQIEVDEAIMGTTAVDTCWRCN
jgi:hypothetical protein